jgi:hypothetical protein
MGASELDDENAISAIKTTVVMGEVPVIDQTACDISRPLYQESDREIQ